MTVPQLRVLDLTDELAAVAGRLFVGMGADVLRIETSDQSRGTTTERLHWHSGKRVVCADPGAVDNIVCQLVTGADVVLESGAVAGLRTLALRERDPRAWSHVAHVVVTPFGLTGPRSDWIADDTVATAAGGMAWLGGELGSAPTPPPHGQATQLAGTHAAIGALLALVARRHTGEGQLVEVSVQEAVAATLETGAIAWIHAGTVPGRTGGVYSHVAHRVFATSDGFVAGGYSGPDRMWDELLTWMAEEGEAADLTDPVWRDPAYRWQHRPHVDAVVADFCRRHSAEEIAQQGLERALPWAEVAAPADLLNNPQLAARRFLIDIESPNGVVRDVGFPYESPSRSRPVRLAAAQSSGTAPVWKTTLEDEWPSSVRKGRRRKSHASAALQGVRVLDLTWVLAGPYVTRTLGDNGADIIKIESRHRQDPTRLAPGMRLRPHAGSDDSGYFINFNRNKRSLALNLRSKEGPDLLRQLAAEVDVIIENFSPGTLDKWGLGWKDLRSLNPDVVLVSMSGVGATGPWRNAVTFADTLAAMSGLTHENADATGGPQGLTFGLGDMVAANAATLATLEHLLRGTAGHVDLSQLEAMSAHLGTALLDAQLPDADSSGELGPMLLRARGEDRWLAVGKTEAVHLAAAVSAILTNLGDDPVAALADAATERDADELAAALQQRGVAAYPVRDGRDLCTFDPQLAARSFYPVQEHPIAGIVQVEGIVAHLTGTPAEIRSPAPLLGQHSDEVLGEILGLNQHEIDRLHDMGVLE